MRESGYNILREAGNKNKTKTNFKYLYIYIYIYIYIFKNVLSVYYLLQYDVNTHKKAFILIHEVIFNMTSYSILAVGMVLRATPTPSWCGCFATPEAHPCA